MCEEGRTEDDDRDATHPHGSAVTIILFLSISGDNESVTVSSIHQV